MANEQKVVESETAHMLFSRLSNRPSFKEIEPSIFFTSNDDVNCIEFCGKESSGKTEILLHLIINTILPTEWKKLCLHGKESCAILFDLDNKFSLIRLTTLLEQRLFNSVEKLSTNGGHDKTEYTNEHSVKNFVGSCLKRFFKVTCQSTTEFIVSLHSMNMFLKEHPDCILLLIDNITYFYWIDSLYTTNHHKYSENVLIVARILKQLIDFFNVKVVLTKLNVSDDSWKFSQWSDVASKRYHLSKEKLVSEKKQYYNCKPSDGNHCVKFFITSNGIEFV